MLSPEQAAKLLQDAGYTAAQIVRMDRGEFDRTVTSLLAGPKKPARTLPASKPRLVDIENQEQFQIWLREAPAGQKRAYFHDKNSLASFRVQAAQRITLLHRRVDRSTQSDPRPATEDMELNRLQMTLALCRQVLSASEMKLVHLTQERAPDGKGWVYFVTKKPRPGVTYADSKR